MFGSKDDLRKIILKERRVSESMTQGGDSLVAQQGVNVGMDHRDRIKGRIPVVTVHRLMQLLLCGEFLFAFRHDLIPEATVAMIGSHIVDSGVQVFGVVPRERALEVSYGIPEVQEPTRIPQ